MCLTLQGEVKTNVCIREAVTHLWLLTWADRTILLCDCTTGCKSLPSLVSGDTQALVLEFHDKWAFPVCNP